MLATLLSWFRDTGRFLASHPGPLALVVTGLLGGVISGLPVGDAMFTYMWRNPSFCDDCHVHDFANEACFRSVHGGVTTCHDCHKVPVRHYPRNLWVTVFDTHETRSDIPTPHLPLVVCGQCHLSTQEEEPLTGPLTDEDRKHVVKIDDAPLHRAHLDAKQRKPSGYHGGTDQPPRANRSGAEDEPDPTAGAITCLDCHGSDEGEAHQFTATRNDCVSCHGELELPKGHLTTVDCTQCHLEGFLAPERTASATP